jgi:hypothetical protein
MYQGRVVVGASLLALAGCTASSATTTTTTPLANGTVTSCLRDADGYVAAGGVMQNLRSTPSRVEITVAVIDAMTGKQVDFTQAKSGVLQPNESQTYTAAVYDVTTGQSSVPMYMTVKCRVTNVTAMDPDAIG